MDTWNLRIDNGGNNEGDKMKKIIKSAEYISCMALINPEFLLKYFNKTKVLFHMFMFFMTRLGILRNVHGSD